MASARRAALVSGLGALRTAIRRARTVFSIPKDPTIKACLDYVYEFYVLMEFLSECEQAGPVKYVPGFGPNGDSFPRKPAAKAGRPKFLLHTNGVVVAQVCVGTQIADQHGMARAPDISVQIGAATDNPSMSDTIAILDAKFSRDDGRIDHPDFSQFARLVELLIPLSPVGQTPLAATNTFHGNCLVTNGQFSTEPDGELRRKNVREVQRCHPATKGLLACRP